MDSLKHLEKRFKDLIWWTPAQIRDSEIEFLNQDEDYKTNIQLLRNLCINETERRKNLPKEFVKCPRCYGYHGQLENIDNLCEKCEQQTACFRYDKKLNL